MKFWEAVEVARATGKKIGVKSTLTGLVGNISGWNSGGMFWDNCSQPVCIDGSALDADWQVIEPPPKEYDFSDAYRMMKEGKWMKAIDKMDCRVKIGEKWFIKQIGCEKSYICDRIPFELLDSKWIEVQP